MSDRSMKGFVITGSTQSGILLVVETPRPPLVVLEARTPRQQSAIDNLDRAARLEPERPMRTVLAQASKAFGG